MDTPPVQAAPATTTRRSLFLLMFGVVWPSFTILLEWGTRACASQFFDPLPTPAHLLLAALVPWVYWLARAREPGSIAPPWLRAALGAAGMVASFYLLCFWGLTLMAGLGIVFSPMLLAAGGIPLVVLLPFATLGPFWAWVSFWKARKRLRPDPGSVGFRRHAFWLGAAGALMLLMGAETPLWITRNAAVRHERAPASEKAGWIKELRNWGSEEILRGMAYGGPHSKASPVDWIMSGRAGFAVWNQEYMDFAIPSEAAQTLYYRVHGRLYSDLPPSKKLAAFDLESGRRFASELDEGLAWDDNHGGDVVGARLRGLRMESSRMDWHLDAPSRLAYGEWTLSFHNSRPAAQEARCQILLPPGGFVSRLTLWVNGEPREAAFSTQAKVKTAYQQVAVQQRRDPVLVNMTGPDRVMCQCFPVPPNGSIQIRLGITAPLAGTGLHMPVFLERNFSVPATARHATWVQSAHDFTTSDPRPPVREPGQLTWRHDLGDEALKELRFMLTAEAPQPEAVWCEDPCPQEGRGGFFAGVWKTGTAAAPKSLVVVVDTSLAMRPWAAGIGKAVAALAEKVPVTVLAGADEGWQEMPLETASLAWSSGSFLGGRDSAPALEEALNRARAGGGEVVWLHGPQPFSFGKHAGLEQILERSATPPALHTCALVHGPNRLLERLHRQHALRPTGRCSDDAGLVSLMRALTGEAARRDVAITRQETQPPGERVWDHLARLGVYQQVLSAARSDLPDPAPMSLLAASYQLVTPLSGAVVLETVEQYKRAGLEAVDPNSTPQVPKVVVPEPSRLILLAAALAVLVLRRRRAGRESVA